MTQSHHNISPLQSGCLDAAAGRVLSALQASTPAQASLKLLVQVLSQGLVQAGLELDS